MVYLNIVESGISLPKYRKISIIFPVFQVQNCNTEQDFRTGVIPYDSYSLYFNPAFRRALIKRSLSAFRKL